MDLYIEIILVFIHAVLPLSDPLKSVFLLCIRNVSEKGEDVTKELCYLHELEMVGRPYRHLDSH